MAESAPSVELEPKDDEIDSSWLVEAGDDDDVVEEDDE